MAKFNSKNVKKQGKYGTITMTLGQVMKALKEGRVKIPEEQRKMENEGAEYRKKRNAFIAYLLVHAFAESNIDSEMQELVANTFGDDVIFVQGVPQFIGISIDKNGNIYLSDGQHRFLHYLKDFLHGGLKLVNGTDFGNDFINEAMNHIFDAVELEDGDGCSDEDKYLCVDMLSKNDLNRLLDIKVVASVVKAASEDERASLFISMNSCTPIKQADQDKAAYCRYTMWKSIANVKEALDSTDCRKDKCMSLGSKKMYNIHDAEILKTLFNAQMRTLVPIIAHAGLLTYLDVDRRRQYQWLYGSTQTQAEQVRNFFKATANMSRKECDELLNRMMDDIVKIGHKMYGDEIGLMQLSKGLKSLLVGQMHAMNKCEIDEDELFDISADIIEQLIVNHKYKPVNDGRDFDPGYFNNGHKSRVKNELFYTWVMAENAVRVGERV